MISYCKWKLTTVNPHERNARSSGVKSAIPAASQLPGGSPLMGMMPLELYVNKKPDNDDYTEDQPYRTQQSC